MAFSLIDLSIVFDKPVVPEAAKPSVGVAAAQQGNYNTSIVFWGKIEKINQNKLMRKLGKLRQFKVNRQADWYRDKHIKEVSA